MTLSQKSKSSKTNRVRAVSVTAALALILAVIAVGIVTIRTSNPVTSSLWRVAEAFASPGEFLWWATLGDAFAGYPSGFSGYLLWVGGTALFWFVVTMVLRAATARLRAFF